MQFIIVASDEASELGRHLAHALSIQKAHSGAYWTVKHYKDNEAQLAGKQPVIFLGENEVAKTYISVLPQRFHAFGTTCSYEGTKAILITSEPFEVSHEEIVTLKREIDELRRRVTIDSNGSMNGGAGAAGVGAIAAAFGAAFLPLGPAGFIAYVIYLYMGAQKRKQEYRKLQLEYVLWRFLKDELATYINGIEECG